MNPMNLKLLISLFRIGTVTYAIIIPTVHTHTNKIILRIFYSVVSVVGYLYMYYEHVKNVFTHKFSTQRIPQMKKNIKTQTVNKDTMELALQLYSWYEYIMCHKNVQIQCNSAYAFHFLSYCLCKSFFSSQVS
jgi:hypothetical protein